MLLQTFIHADLARNGIDRFAAVVFIPNLRASIVVALAIISDLANRAEAGRIGFWK